MHQLQYVMQFRGKAEHVGNDPVRLSAKTSAPACRVTTAVGTAGLTCNFERLPDGGAEFESTVEFTGEGAFQETGVISFGSFGSLHFSTIGQGHLGLSVEPGLQHGVVSWRIDRGEGRLAGASGLITSNFTVSEDGTVIDNQFGVLFLPNSN